MIDNYEDVLDSRDIVARVEQLQAIREPGPVPDGVLEDEDYATDQDSLFAELATLENLIRDINYYSGDDAEDGVTLIRDSYFTSYAIELAEDLGAVPEEYTWPTSCIDWEKAARELQMDYTPVEFNGVTYWVR